MRMIKTSLAVTICLLISYFSRYCGTVIHRYHSLSSPRYKEYLAGVEKSADWNTDCRFVCLSIHLFVFFGNPTFQSVI